MTEGKRKILVVDDRKVNRQLLFMAFSQEYDVLEAADGQEALAKLLRFLEEIDVILLDLVMPVMDGLSFLKILRQRGLTGRIPVILITARQEKECEKQCFSYGAADYVTRPFDPEIMQKRVKRAIKLRNYEKRLEQRISNQERTILFYAGRLYRMNCSLIESIADIVEFRSLESGTHVKRIRRWVEILARCVRENFPEYGLKEQDVERMAVTCVMHDLGKIMIPDTILNKPGKLTAEEYEKMKQHTVYGAKIIEKSVDFPDREYAGCAWNIARYHHERYDGNGYPDHLRGEQIPVEAQITALADVFDALVSERCYKKAVAPQKAYEMILAGECGSFSEKMLEALKKSKDEIFCASEQLKG